MPTIRNVTTRIPVVDRVLPQADDLVRGALALACSGLGRIPPTRLIDVVEAVRSTAFGLGSVLAIHASTQPDKVAIYDRAGETTFEQLNVRVNRLANVLDADGAAQGGRVAFMLPNCREAVEAIGASAKLGMAPVPVNTRFHPEEVARLLEKQNAQALIIDAEYRDCAAGFDGTVLIRGDDYEDRLALADPEPPPRPTRAPIPEAVIHTSGTTGHPKGAERNLTKSGALGVLSFFARVPVSSNDVIIVPAPLFHSLGLAGGIFGFIFGAELVLQERFDAEEFCRLVDERSATAGVVVPVMLRRIVGVDRDVLDGLDLDAMRWMLVSGSHLPPALEQASREIFGPVVRNLYGSTEAGWVSIATPDDVEMHPGTVGRPMAGVSVQIIGDKNEPVPVGEPGEISIRSRTVFSGYTEDLQNGAGRHGDQFDLGDLGYLDADGYLYVLDRKDDMVVTGGENVYPAEVERVLADQPDLKDAVVLGADDEEFGKILVAFLVLESGSEVTAEQIDERLRAHLANYKVPKKIWLVDELPYNATGKVLRRALRDEARERLAAD